MKIYTYRNPFKLTNSTFWEEIKDYPHFCISETLVQGLKHCYNRTAFDCIGTIDSLFKEFFKTWEDNPQIKIKQYISLSEEIENIKEPLLRRTIKRNQREIMDSIRFLCELGIKPSDIEITGLTDEQKVLIDLYSRLYNQDVWNIISITNQIGVKKLVNSFKLLLENEIDSKKNENIHRKLRKKDEREIEKIENVMNKYSDELTSGEFSIKGIVFHGIHQFTPLQFVFFEFLKNHNIEIVFLFNYVPEYKNIYSTWRSVYDWTSLPLIEEISPESKIHFKNEIGKALGNVVQGKPANEQKIEIKKFGNITTFAEYISELFTEARDLSESRTGVLSKMSEQFYSPNNNEINDLLRSFFPDHFGERHFLAYPIGQFVLAIYNMWNTSAEELHINPIQLKECLSVNFFKQEGVSSPVDLYEKIELYFSGLTTIKQYYQQIHKLESTITEISITPEKSDLIDLVKFSFYNVSVDELMYFKKCLESIDRISQELFKRQNTSKVVNYRNHYQYLVKLLNEFSEGPFVLDKEKQLIEEIQKKFNNIDELEIEGSAEDLKETIHFYLGRAQSEDSSRWIVRNFQQLDGGVLLSNDLSKLDKTYHLCMLSDQKMKVKVNDLLPWPLSRSFFDSCRYEIKTVNIVLNSLEEYGNFLRYSLFYSTYYLENKLCFSFVEQKSGEMNEKESPYFLLELLGFETKDFDLSELNSMRPGIPVAPLSFRSKVINNRLSMEELQTFELCSYRFLLDNYVLPVSFYQNEYHYKLYYRAIVLKRAWKALEGKPESDISNVVSQISSSLEQLFPFWKKTDFYDLEAWVKRDLQKQVNEFGIVNEVDSGYLSLRLNFLYAQLTEGRPNQNNQDGEMSNLLKPLHKLMRDEQYRNEVNNNIRNYFQRSEIFLNRKPDTIICNYCKQSEICLHGYKEGASDE